MRWSSFGLTLIDRQLQSFEARSHYICICYFDNPENEKAWSNRVKSYLQLTLSCTVLLTAGGTPLLAMHM